MTFTVFRAFVTVAFWLLASGAAQAQSAPAGCDPAVLSQMNAKSQQLAAYDADVTNTLIDQPDSVLKTTCYDEAMAAPEGQALQPCAAMQEMRDKVASGELAEVPDLNAFLNKSGNTSGGSSASTPQVPNLSGAQKPCEVLEMMGKKDACKNAGN